MFNILKMLFCKHKYERIYGSSGSFHKCVKCGLLYNQFDYTQMSERKRKKIFKNTIN